MQKKKKTTVSNTINKFKMQHKRIAFNGLVESQKLLKEILNNSQDIIILYNSNKKKILLINNNFFKILNYKIKEIKSLANEDFHNLMHSEDYKRYLKNITPTNDINNLTSEYRLRINNTKNFKWFRENIFVIEKDEANNPNIILYILIEITDYKELEKRLLEYEDKIKELEKIQQYANWELDLKTNRIRFSEKMYELFDIKPNTKISKEQFLKFIHYEDLKNFKTSLLKSIQGEAQQIINKIKLKSGKIRYISTSLKPVFNNKNSVIKVEGISLDISERKLAEKKLKEFTDELKDLNKSKDKYFSIIAHDLRGPFTGLLGFSNLLKEEFDYLTREEVKHYIGLINSSLKNVYGLIENLLQWSRLQTGRLIFQPENISLNTVIEEIVTLFKTQAMAKYLDIHIDIPENTFVYADENMIKSVLQNLISNSIKFSEEGGRIIINAEENNNKYTISVSDTGIGIPPEVIDKIFRIDFHYTTPGTRDEKGSGLGLILCKEFISKHGFLLRIKSEQKIGTTVSFDLKKGKIPKTK